MRGNACAKNYGEITLNISNREYEMKTKYITAVYKFDDEVEMNAVLEVLRHKFYQGRICAMVNEDVVCKLDQVREIAYKMEHGELCDILDGASS